MTMRPREPASAHTHACTHTKTHIKTHTQACKYKYTQRNTHTHTCTHKHAHTHTHTRTHTHTHTPSLSLTHTHTGGLPTCDWMMPWPPLNGDLRSLSLRWRLLRLLRWSCCRNLAICRQMDRTTDGRTEHMSAICGRIGRPINLLFTVYNKGSRPLTLA